MEKELSLEEKLQSLFMKLHTVHHSAIEDDTVLQKLQSSLQKQIERKENALVWSEHIGLVAYICESLEEDLVRNGRNYATIAFALHCLSSLVAKEENFLILYQQKVMSNFLKVLPIVQENMSLTSNALKVTESLIGHSSGISWVIENGIWENLLISSLKSQSIFVQRACITVITTLLLKVEDSKRFTNYVCDLELVLYKFREAKLKLKELREEDVEVDEYSLASAVAKLSFNSQTVLLIFHTMLLESLGKRSLYFQLRHILDLMSKILFRFNFDMSSTTVIQLCKMLLLSTLHRFQDQILKFGTAEQFHLDSVTSDILSLIRHMINKGYYAEFLLASFEVHKYWDIMHRNIKERNDAELSKCESIIYIILKLQIVPLRVLCSSSLDMGSEEDRRTFEQNYSKWKNNFMDRMSIREDQKLEIIRLVDLLKEKFASNLKAANEQCISHLTHSASVIEYLHPTCAATLFQVLIFVLKFKIQATSTLECNPRFYFNSVDLLRLLIERFEIDWQNCYESRSVLPLLYSVFWIPGITTRVKVSTLQTINACLAKVIPPVAVHPHSCLDSTKKVEEIDFDKLGETFTLYLSDMEWEVRDSALELILTSIKVQKEKYPSFVDWFLRFGLLNHILQAIGDIEPYVQATAIAILATVVSVDEIWGKLDDRSMKQRSLRAVVRSGEGCIRKAGLQLLEALLFNSKFKSDEINKYVLPVVQAATSDPDDEIRLVALKFIHHHLDMELVLMGMVDGEFPRVTFQSGKITNLEQEEVEKRVSSLICGFCQNGYFQGVMNCSNDNVRAVAMESNSILNFIEMLIKKYNLRVTLSSCLNGCEMASYPNPLPPLSGKGDDEVKLDIKEPSSAKGDKGGLEYVLETSDLTVISKLKNKEPCNFDNWWNGEVSENPLKEEEIPAKLSTVSAVSLFKELERARNAVVYTVDNHEDLEKEISLLLEDIFLVTGTSQEENESRARDCY